MFKHINRRAYLKHPDFISYVPRAFVEIASNQLPCEAGGTRSIANEVKSTLVTL